MIWTVSKCRFFARELPNACDHQDVYEDDVDVADVEIPSRGSSLTHAITTMLPKVNVANVTSI